MSARSSTWREEARRGRARRRGRASSPARRWRRLPGRSARSSFSMKPSGSLPLPPIGRSAMVRPGLARRTGAEGVAAARRFATEARMPDTMPGTSCTTSAIGFARQEQHLAVARGDDVRRARAAAEEGELADRLARADLGDGARPPVERHEEAAGEDNVELVGRIALAHQQRAARDALALCLRLEPPAVWLPADRRARGRNRARRQARHRKAGDARSPPSPARRRYENPRLQVHATPHDRPASAGPRVNVS